MKESIQFLQNFYHCFRHIKNLVALLFCLVMLGALGFSKAEGIDFGSSVFFAFITALTVGYGDISPTTVLGRIISVLIAFMGILLVAMFTAIATRALFKTMHPEDFPEAMSHARSKRKTTI